MSALGSLRDNFPQCELPGCRRRSIAWRVLGRGGEGMRLGDRWFCSPGCFEAALAEVYRDLMPGAQNRQSNRHRMPLGLVLFSLGMITQENLRSALDAQREAGAGRIGDWLRQAGAVDENQVTSAVARQWSCPVFPLEGHSRFLDCAHLVPLPLLESARMVPVHHLPESGVLYVAFADSVDYTTLYGVQQMLEVRTEACLATESSVDRALEQLRQLPRSGECVFETSDPQEMAAATRARAMKFAPEETRVVSCGSYIWTRMESGERTCDVLFRIPRQ